MSDLIPTDNWLSIYYLVEETHLLLSYSFSLILTFYYSIIFCLFDYSSFNLYCYWFLYCSMSKTISRLYWIASPNYLLASIYFQHKLSSPSITTPNLLHHSFKFLRLLEIKLFISTVDTPLSSNSNKCASHPIKLGSLIWTG